MKLTRITSACVAAASALALTACGNGTEVDYPELAGAPAGFTPTNDGAVLSFGEPAYVVAVDDVSGQPRYWEVVADEPTSVSVEEVESRTGGQVSDAATTEEFVCFTFTATLLGAPDGENSPGTFRFGHAAADGGQANITSEANLSSAETCQIAEEDQIPYNLSETEEGRAYRGSSLSFIATDDGVDPKRATVEVGDEDSEYPEVTVSWKKLPWLPF